MGENPPLRLLLLGYGHVTQSFLPLLASRSVWLEQELMMRPVLNGIGSRSRGLYVHPDGIDASSLTGEADVFGWFSKTGQRLEDAKEFIQAGKAVGATLLIELTTLNPQTGQPALDHVRTALKANMDVVTANKGPIAHAQTELQTLARQCGVQLRFESTVMDGLPIFNLAQFCLPAAGIQSFRALLNTTSSLVLSSIE